MWHWSTNIRLRVLLQLQKSLAGWWCGMAHRFHLWLLLLHNNGLRWLIARLVKCYIALDGVGRNLRGGGVGCGDLLLDRRSSDRGSDRSSSGGSGGGSGGSSDWCSLLGLIGYLLWKSNLWCDNIRSLLLLNLDRLSLNLLDHSNRSSVILLGRGRSSDIGGDSCVLGRLNWRSCIRGSLLWLGILLGTVLVLDAYLGDGCGGLGVTHGGTGWTGSRCEIS